MRNANFVKSERGQMMLVFALVLTVLILFTGLALDAGLLYVTKAKLSTSVDAACLTGMRNLSSGQTTATTLATGMFNANYGPNPPTPTHHISHGCLWQPAGQGNRHGEREHPVYACSLAMGKRTGGRYRRFHTWQADHVHRAGSLRLNEHGWRRIGTASCRSSLRQ